MPTPAHPHRVRLYGGRHTHNVQPGFVVGHFTACGTVVHRNDHRLPADEPVTCPACKRTLAKENQ
ncbi:hypothetical protein [Streptomyces cinereoruber]|uniref:hypothetical protein n=1 Tax=Streptomyces cinereoruber TaxID=67260 RepID=UPI0036315AE6